MSWIFDTVLEHEHITEYSYYGKRIQIQTEWKRWWHKLHDISPLTSVNTTITICSILFFQYQTSITNSELFINMLCKYLHQLKRSIVTSFRKEMQFLRVSPDTRQTKCCSCFDWKTDITRIFLTKNIYLSNIYKQSRMLLSTTNCGQLIWIIWFFTVSFEVTHFVLGFTTIRI